jgi:hypothetical protein
MTPERWRQVEQLLQRALECDAAARGALLEQACAGDVPTTGTSRARPRPCWIEKLTPNTNENSQ